MRVLVFGRNGQVARALAEQVSGGDLATVLGRADADLMTPGLGAAAVAAHKPDVVINAAAYTAVDKAEEDRDAAARLNCEAASELAKAAEENGATFIHISTDYVFDGARDHPYREDDSVNPLGVYGATKRDGEIAVMTANPDAVILRTSWVFSEFGGNFVKTMLRLGGERGALNVVDDQVGGPTSARDIADAILAIAAKRRRGAPGSGVYHYQGAPAVSWAEFAEAIFDAAGMNVAVARIPTSAYPTPARRPLRTVLDCAKIERDFGVAAPDWRAALTHVITALSPQK